MLGHAIEKTYPGALLTVGPATKEGFFYDFFHPEDKKVTEEDYSKLMKSI